MKSIIVKINDLIDAHGKTYTKCEDPNCEICNQIRNLSEKLCPGFKETKKKHVVPFKDRMTKDRYLKLKRRGYTDKTIAFEYGVSLSAISKWKKKHLSGEEKKIMKESKQNGTKQLEEINITQLQLEIERLSKENETLKIEMERMSREIKDLEKQKERYFADYLSLEHEVKGLRLYTFEKLKKDVYGA